MVAALVLVALLAFSAQKSLAVSVSCKDGTTQTDAFLLNGTQWLACEDLGAADGALLLMSALGHAEWFSKTYEGSPYDYYLGKNVTVTVTSRKGRKNITLTGKDAVAAATATEEPGTGFDILGLALLNTTKFPFLTRQLVESALPPIAGTGTFVGSRSSSVDTSIGPDGADASDYGFPTLCYVLNLTTLPPRPRQHQAQERPAARLGSVGCSASHFNMSLASEGLVGGHLPVARFVFPSINGSTYVEMIAAGVPDMQGSREQSVWFRYSTLECAGPRMAPPCRRVGRPKYFDTYWWSSRPNAGQTGQTGPQQPAPAAGFYANLLEVRRWWREELASEGMMQLPSLPSPVSTNGTHLAAQAIGSIIRTMITRKDTWFPRYGVNIGYGVNMQNGFQDTFTTTAQAALEFGAMEWAKGLIDNEFHHYILDDGMVRYRGEELPQSARMLTILALYYSYNSASEPQAAAFLLQHFGRAKAVADFLTMRRSLTLGHAREDPRYGMLPGDDEADNYNRLYFHQDASLHFYSSAAEFYRAAVELGAVWQDIGARHNRTDVMAHGAALLALAPLLYRDLHASLGRTVNTTASKGVRCYPHRVEGSDNETVGQMGAAYRSYPEMFFSGALTEQQTDDMYKSGLGLGGCPISWWLAVGTPAAGPNFFTHVPFGFPHGLLQHDMVERFLLHFFTQSAHGSSRGFWMTPESSSINDRTHNVWFSAAGPNNVPLCLKWMLVFEELETRTLWLGKATPRDWLVPGESPIKVVNATTRYGRISVSFAAASASASGPGVLPRGAYSVKIGVTVPQSFGATGTQPAGGLRIRIRAPLEHAGKLSAVEVGGQPWHSFNASAETVDFSQADLTPTLIRDGLPTIVATFSAAVAVPLRRASIDMSLRALPKPVVVRHAPQQSGVRYRATGDAASAAASVPACPAGMQPVETFQLNATTWVACQDLQEPGGALALFSAAGRAEWFSQGYEAYGTNTTDDTTYYLGLGRDAVANAGRDILGDKLLAQGDPTWAAVAKAVPPIRKSGTTPGGWQYQVSDCDGVRTFIGSRGASIDYTFNDFAQDCSYDSGLSVGSYAQAMHNKAVGDAPQSWNRSGVAEGMIGGHLPSAIFYFPVYSPDASNCTHEMQAAFCNFTGAPRRTPACAIPCNRHNPTRPPAWCEQCASCVKVLDEFCTTAPLLPTKQSECSSCVASVVKARPGAMHRYWQYLHVPKPDMQGNREQGSWVRLQQVSCSGPEMQPPCSLVGWPMYWESMWFSRFPSASPAANMSNITGGANSSVRSPAGFYANLLELRRWWDAELAAEQMMQLVSVPSPASVNGTQLWTQAVSSIVRSMITRDKKWHPRYGVTPGFGEDALNGLMDVFSSTATAALEFGAMPYARGVIDNQFTFFVRADGMINHRGVEVPSSARMLTILACYYGYSGGDATFMLKHFAKAKALANLLVYKRSLSLNYSRGDPRYGIPQGGSEAGAFFTAGLVFEPEVMEQAPARHFYASAAELYRACREIGAVWVSVGQAAARADVAAHGKTLLALAPLLYSDLHASLNQTVAATGNPSAPRLWPFIAEPKALLPPHDLGGHAYKAYPDMMWSGALTAQQVNDTYNFLAAGGLSTSLGSLTLGVPGWNTSVSLRAPFGLAYGLLQHDMVPRFLLHFFAVSAHGYTRGTWTTPESSNLADRDEPTIPYASTGIHTVPIYLKWMLVFEELETRTLWLGKATPRDWLVPGESPIKVVNATTRYGRISVSFAAASASASGPGVLPRGAYSVKIGVTVPQSFGATGTQPAGGLRIRIRAPLEHAGKLSAVEVGGQPWHSFNASAETVDFSQADLTPTLIRDGLPMIVATFA